MGPTPPDDPTLPPDSRPVGATLSVNGPTADPNATIDQIASPADTGLAPGVVGDYELLGEIARGGMGVVFRARQRGLNRVVALKMVLAGRLASAAEVRRFRLEAESAAALDHPNIVPIYDVGEHAGLPYFSMALVGGGSLAGKIAAGPLSPREAAELLAPLADAVQYAHEQGVVHRDLKPANVLIDDRGTPKITDFGLAKRPQVADGPTATGDVLGTPGYMPPEQAAGNPALVGPLADVYSLGAVLYAMVTGRPPFHAATPLDTILQVLDREPERPSKLRPGLPRDLETVCLKCLEKRPDRRYRSAGELAGDLRLFLAGEPVRARRAAVVRRAAAWARRRPWAIAAGVTALLVVVSFLAYGLVDELRRRRWTELYLRAVVERLQPTTDRAAADQRVLDQLRQAAAIRPDGRLYGESLHVWRRDAAVCDPIRPAPGAAGDPLSPEDRAKRLTPVGWNRGGQRLQLPGGEFDLTTRRWSPLAGGRDAVADPTGAIVAVPDDGGLRLVDRVTGAERRRIGPWPGGVERFEFAADGSTLAVLTGGRPFRLWAINVTGGRPPIPAAAVDAEDNRSPIFGLSGDGRRLGWWAAGRHEIAVVNTDTGEATAQVPLAANMTRLPCLALSPDGAHVAWPDDGLSLFSTPAVVIQDVTTTAVVRRLPILHELSGVRTLSYSPDGGRVIGSGWEHVRRLNGGWPESRVWLWDATTGGLVAWWPADVGAAGPTGAVATITTADEPGPPDLEVWRPEVLAARTADAGLTPSLHNVGGLPEVDLIVGVGFGWPTLLTFGLFGTVGITDRVYKRRNRWVPVWIAWSAAGLGAVCLVWAVLRGLNVFDLPNWSVGFLFVAAVATCLPLSAGVWLVGFGVWSGMRSSAGQPRPADERLVSVQEVKRAESGLAPVLSWVYYFLILDLAITALDGGLSQLGLLGAVAALGICQFIVAFVAMGVSVAARRSATSWGWHGLRSRRVIVAAWGGVVIAAAAVIAVTLPGRWTLWDWRHVLGVKLGWGLIATQPVTPDPGPSWPLALALLGLGVGLSGIVRTARGRPDRRGDA